MGRDPPGGRRRSAAGQATCSPARRASTGPPLPIVSSNEGSGNGPGQITLHNTVVLPNAKACVRQRSLKIKLRDPKYDPLKEVLVKIKGKLHGGKSNKRH
jgi:hypothetical protein